MKQTLLFAALGLVAAGAAAQEVGLVVSSVPVVQQVAVQRQVCNNQQLMVEQQTSGAGGLIGALAGAAIGSQIGSGNGRGVATVLGTVGGAVIGNNIEAGNRYVQNVPQCSTQTSYENRAVGYNVTYEYAGRQHTVQMPYDPGATVQLQISPIGTGDPGQPQQQAYASGPQGPVVIAPPLQQQPLYIAAPRPVVYSGYPAYPIYAPVYRPFYPPVGVSLNFGFGHRHGGHRHGGHRHGRNWR